MQLAFENKADAARGGVAGIYGIADPLISLSWPGRGGVVHPFNERTVSLGFNEPPLLRGSRAYKGVTVCCEPRLTSLGRQCHILGRLLC